VTPRLVPLLVLLAASMAPLGTIRLLLTAQHGDDEYEVGHEGHVHRRRAGPRTETRPVGQQVNKNDDAAFTTRIVGGGSVDGDDDDAVKRSFPQDGSATFDRMQSSTSTPPIASMPFLSSWRSSATSTLDPSFCWNGRPWIFATMQQQQHPFIGEAAGGVGLFYRFEHEGAAEVPLHHHAEQILLWMVLCVFGVVLPAGEWGGSANALCARRSLAMNDRNFSFLHGLRFLCSPFDR
jgi:hypothetical protein